MVSFSRRHMIGAAAALWPGLAMAAAPPTGEPERIQGRSDPDSRLTIKVMIGGKGPFDFVVDTGADRSVLAADLATSLGFVPSQDVMVQGIARAVPARAVVLRDLQLGRITVDSLNTPVLPREWLGVDGYLGLDAIDGRRVDFDFRNRALTIGRSAAYGLAPERNEALVRVEGSHGRLTDVSARVDGVRAAAFVDSGAEISIGNTHLFAQLQQANDAAYLNDIRIPLFGVTGGELAGRLAFARQVKLGRLTFTNVLLVICDLDVFDSWGLAERPALLIGMNLLKKASLFTIDYGRKELLFRLAGLPPVDRVSRA